LKNSAAVEPQQGTEQTYCYVLFGVLFETDEPIPGLAGASGNGRAVRLRFGAVPQAIAKPDYEDASVQASATEYLFSCPGLLRLYVNPAAEIVVERQQGCDPLRLWTLVLGIGASIAGFRKGYVPLHAAALEACGGCIALAGQENFGKSTLAAALNGLGFTLHADDLCLIQPAASGPPLVGAGVREIRLRADAVEELGWSGRQAYAAIPAIGKTVYRLAATPPSLLPLKRIYVLQYADEENPPGIHRCEGVEAMQALIGCLRLRMGLLAVGARQKTFESLASISSAVEVYRFVRPFDRVQLHVWSELLAVHLTS
jgi:hypothetical protein